MGEERASRAKHLANQHRGPRQRATLRQHVARSRNGDEGCHPANPTGLVEKIHGAKGGESAPVLGNLLPGGESSEWKFPTKMF